MFLIDVIDYVDVVGNAPNVIALGHVVPFRIPGDFNRSRGIRRRRQIAMHFVEIG